MIKGLLRITHYRRMIYARSEVRLRVMSDMRALCCLRFGSFLALFWLHFDVYRFASVLVGVSFWLRFGSVLLPGTILPPIW